LSSSKIRILDLFGLKKGLKTAIFQILKTKTVLKRTTSLGTWVGLLSVALALFFSRLIAIPEFNTAKFECRTSYVHWFVFGKPVHLWCSH